MQEQDCMTKDDERSAAAIPYQGESIKLLLGLVCLFCPLAGIARAPVSPVQAASWLDMEHYYLPK